MSRPDTLTREEQAQREIGETEVSPFVARFLSLSFLLVILSVPVVQIAHDLIALRSPDNPARDILRGTELLAMIPSMSEVLGVRTPTDVLEVLPSIQEIEEFETGLEEDSVLAGAIRKPMQWLVTVGLRSGTEQAYLGRDGWLFYRPGIDYVTGRGFLDSRYQLERSRSGSEGSTRVEPDPIKAIIEFGGQLAERDIKLIVLPTPVKPVISPEAFSRRYSESSQPVHNADYSGFLEALSEAGIEVLDVSDSLFEHKAHGTPVYLRQDTHWSPEGLQVVAERLAAAIDQGGYGLVQGGHVPYSAESLQVAAQGDIVGMLDLSDDLNPFRPEAVTIRQVRLENGSLWKPDPEAEILLLGDSFSNIYSLEGMGWGVSAGLAEQLSYELQRPVDAIRRNDGGAYATRLDLSRKAQQGEDPLAGKKVVIYQFAERELSVGDWKTGLDLTVADAGQSTARNLAMENREVSGRIAAITRSPRPGTVAYKDAIVALHLKNLEGLQEEAGADGIVVFVWGMRDNKLTGAERFTVGERVTLPLTPWAEVESALGSYQRVELDDPDLLFLETFWGGPHDSEAQPEVSTGQRDVQRDAAAKEETESVDREETDVSGGFSEVLSSHVAEMEAAATSVLAGRDGWLFFKPELEYLTAGEFWGERAKEVSKAVKPEFADPLPAILDFHRQLEEAGIELIIVPVPAKAAVYSDMVPGVEQRIDPAVLAAQQPFYDLLRDQGVSVLNLTDAFLEERDEGTGEVYCRQDTHWSVQGIQIAAREIARQVNQLGPFAEVERSEYVLKEATTEIEGDLWKMHGDTTLPKDSLQILSVTTEDSDSPLEPWRESPVLLLGDSHCLVFHSGGDMHAEGAGLPDHLAKELGFPVDLVGVRGSGATPARVNLLRRRDNLQGKRVVIWCLTVREFTESQNGWQVVPVIRK